MISKIPSVKSLLDSEIARIGMTAELDGIDDVCKRTNELGIRLRACEWGL